MKKHLKVGLILDDSLDTTDGVQQYVLAIGGWLTSKGHEVHYLVGETKRNDIPHIHSLSRNVHVRFNGNRMSMPLPVSRRKIRALLDKEHFDILHVQMPYSPFLAGRILKAARDTPKFGTFHVLPHSPSSRLANEALGRWVRSTVQGFSQVFAVSAAAQTFVQQLYGVEGRVLPNVVDVARFHDAVPLREYDDQVQTIMFLGRLVPRKGCGILLEAITILQQRKNLPPFRVLICGKGPLDMELRQYVADQRLEKIVAFTGFVPEDKKPRYMASADILVFPSTAGESFGIVLLEAMATGRSVVVAGDNPGYRSVLGERPDLLVEPNNAFSLANTLTDFLRDADARKQAVVWGSKYVAQFDVAAVGAQLLETYTRNIN